MSYIFSVNDKVHGIIPPLASGGWTLGCWAAPDGDGALMVTENDVGLVQTLGFGAFLSLTGGQARSGGIAFAQSADPVVSDFGVWACVFCTYGGSVASEPELFVGNLATPVAEVPSYSTQTSASGSRAIDGDELTIGNFSTLASDFDGKIARPFAINRVLSLSEMELFRLGEYWHLFDANIRAFLPFEGSPQNLAGTNFAVSGATVGEGPPVPWGLAAPSLVVQ